MPARRPGATVDSQSRLGCRIELVTPTANKSRFAPTDRQFRDVWVVDIENRPRAESYANTMERSGRCVFHLMDSGSCFSSTRPEGRQIWRVPANEANKNS
jgi:hypothetical protein